MEKKSPLKVALLIGSNPNQKALACKIAREHVVVGVVIEQKSGKGKKKMRSLLSRLIEKIRFWKIDSAWRRLMSHYSNKFKVFPEANQLTVSSINENIVANFLKELDADVVAVSGTSLLKRPLLEAINPSLGMLNLHTGISPYVKGGPNCTNWCIATNQLHLIGNTIMWIDEGIDSGNLVATEFTEIYPNDSFFEVHLKVMEHGHNLYLRTLHLLSKSPSLVPNIPQNEIGEGRLFLSKHWTVEMKKKLLQNLKDFRVLVLEPDFKRKRQSTVLVKLPTP